MVRDLDPPVVTESIPLAILFDNTTREVAGFPPSRVHIRELCSFFVDGRYAIENIEVKTGHWRFLGRAGSEATIKC